MTLSEIASFYASKSVLITGATGFVGKATIEKLLRSCPEIDHVYILLRPQRNETVEGRLRKLLEQRIFDSIRESNPAALLKVVPISGDIGYPNLGLTKEDEGILIEKIAVVIHSAANVNFNADLKTAVNTNICGVQRLVYLARKFKVIEAFVYVSTTFSNYELEEVAEAVYPIEIDINQLIDAVEHLPEEMLADFSRRILGKKPNTYTFTKALAEHFLSTEGGKVPICIVRPCIVTATAHDPFPGWVDNINGPSGLILAIGAGLMRTLKGDPRKIADIIPLDYVVNTIVAASWRLASSRFDHLKIQVYNCCSGQVNPIRWGDWLQYFLKFAVVSPISTVIWWPTDCFTLNGSLDKAKNIFVQYLPAKIIDFTRTMCGKKPVMMRKYQLLQKFSLVSEPIVTREWRFQCDNWKSLQGQMSQADRKTFNMDIAGLNWERYSEDYWNGLQVHVLHDDDRGVVVGSQRLQRIQSVQRTVLILLILGLTFVVHFLLFSSGKLSSHV